MWIVVAHYSLVQFDASKVYAADGEWNLSTTWIDCRAREIGMDNWITHFQLAIAEALAVRQLKAVRQANYSSDCFDKIPCVKENNKCDLFKFNDWSFIYT